MEQPSNSQLIAQLTTGTDRERRHAARRLGKRRAPEAVPALVERLHDERSAMQAAAALALGEIRDPASIPALIRMFNGETYQHIREDGSPGRFHRILGSAGIALATFNLPETTEPLYAALSESITSKRDDVTLLVRAESASYAGGERTYNLLIPLWTQRQYANMRPSLAVCLGRCGGEQAAYELLLALGERDDLMRAAAAEGLGLTGDTSVVPPLIFRLHHAEAGLEPVKVKFHRQMISAKIAQALGLLKTPEALAALKEAFSQPARQFAAAVGLAYAKDTSALDVLLTYATSKDHLNYGLKTTALEALAVLDDARALDALQTFAKEYEYNGLVNYPLVEDALDRWMGLV